MSSLIYFGAINTNTPQQNGGVFIGEINCGGWDANQKLNMAHGAVYGFNNIILNQQAYLFDNFEVIDGVMNDQDFKPIISANF
ncbi:hypothetical protein [Alicyclobacillus sp. ALC3]|uniref:hypothetical protein n=1 Tax=Alicyclobacillus sp. ALC3 TaxID=2796143 RepID=UPI00237985EB|nr:hypothetical protein [Alicyclobacillus sp. ALC3]WDL98776.1 hypothetical protein JC200_09035 [Alicyclobacillus sp. ALC3]